MHKALVEIGDRLSTINKRLASGRLTERDSLSLQQGWACRYKDHQGFDTLAIAHLGALEDTPVFIEPPQEADLKSGNSSLQSNTLNDRDDYLSFITTTLQEDRDGDIVIPRGYRGLNYARNPVWFFGHQQWEIPIGTSASPVNKAIALDVHDDFIRQGCYFDRADPDADFIYGKCKRKILNATSMAFIPLEAYRRDQNHYELGQFARSHNSSDPNAPPGWLFKVWDHTETSIVGVGSNPGALRDSIDKDWRNITPVLHKCLKQYAEKSKKEQGILYTGWLPCPGPNCTPRLRRKQLGTQKGQAVKPCNTCKTSNRSCSCNNTVNKSVKQKYITHSGSSWKVHAESGRVLGTHPSKDQALAQLRAVEASKHREGKKEQKNMGLGGTQADIDNGFRPGSNKKSSKPTQLQPDSAKPNAIQHRMPILVDEDGVGSDGKEPRHIPTTVPQTVNDKIRRRGPSTSKGLNETSGTAGGYLLSEEFPGDKPGKLQKNGGKGKPLTDVTSRHHNICLGCAGEKTCVGCGGKGCDLCNEQGVCPDCHGIGFKVVKPNETIDLGDEMRNKRVSKTVKRTVNKAFEDNEEEERDLASSMERGRGGKPEDEPGEEEIAEDGTHGGEERGEDDAAEVEPGQSKEGFVPKHSASVIAHAFNHAKSENDWLQGEHERMDNPAVADSMQRYHRRYVSPRMDHLTGLLHQHHGQEGDDPDELMDRHVKALTGNAGETTPDAGMEVGENNLTDRGDIPEPEEDEIDTVSEEEEPEMKKKAPPMERDEEDDDMREEEGNDPDTEEILERYQEPRTKKWKTRIFGHIKTLKDGTKMVVRKGVKEFKEGDANQPLGGDKSGSGKKGEEGRPNMGCAEEVFKEMDEEDKEVVKEAMDYMKNLEEDHEVPEHYKSLIKKYYAKMAGNTIAKMITKGIGDQREENDEYPQTESEEGVEAKGVDGGKPEVAASAGPQRFKEAMDDSSELMGDMANDEEVPKRHKGVLKHHSKQLGRLSKALVNMGKFQRDGGSGRVLTAEGAVGWKRPLTDEGELERNTPAPSAKVINGIDGVSKSLKNGRRLPNTIINEFEDLKRMIRQHT